MTDETNTPEIEPFTPGQEKFGRFFIKNLGNWQVRVYEWTNGKLWNKFLGSQVAIFTIKGRKSGRWIKIPLLYLEDGDNVIVVATQGGMSTYPLWYKNMVANPEVACQIGAKKDWYKVRHAEAEEEARLWPPLDAMYAGYAEYRARINGRREIPVMILEPSTAPADQ